MYKLTITCSDNIEVLQQALQPEIAKGNRFQTFVKKNKEKLNVTVTAEDATALKAITSSLLKLIEISENIHGKK